MSGLDVARGARGPAQPPQFTQATLTEAIARLRTDPALAELRTALYDAAMARLIDRTAGDLRRAAQVLADVTGDGRGHDVR
ncbi:hypothetical protein ACH41E_09230 [Streptomyces sp. NPDC020412]|uniref:hypothetical protein n=1 Tax=Streptomyces sp. NPDC020412 TaxID=3365073 RepID=UPI0037894CC5